MTEEQQTAFDKWLEEVSRDAPPYEPKPGDVSLFAGMSAFLGRETREAKLARPIRAFTIDWLAWELARAANMPFDVTRPVMEDAIPDGREDMLDGGDEFIVAFDVAAFALNIDPYAISLRPALLHS